MDQDPRVIELFKTTRANNRGVEYGRLLADGRISPNSEVHARNTSTLGGNGEIVRDITLHDSATLAPGTTGGHAWFDGFALMPATGADGTDGSR